MAKGSTPSGSKTFPPCHNWHRSPLSLLCNGYQVSFPRSKQPGCGVNHPAPQLQRVQLHLYSLSEPSWFVAGQTLTLQAMLLTVNEVYIWLIKLFLCICTTPLWCSEGVDGSHIINPAIRGVVHYIHTPAVSH